MKRSRVDESQRTETLSLMYPPSSVLGIKYAKADGNDVIVKVTEKAKSRSKKKGFAYRDLYNLLCPPFKINRQIFGYCMQNMDTTGAFTSGDTALKLGYAGGTQGFLSFCHLPFFEPTGQSHTEQTSLSQLMTKANSIANFQMITSHSNYTSDTNRNKNEFQFIYSGGKSIHKFVNTGNSDITFTYNIIRPRRPLYVANTSAIGAFNQFPSLMALTDKTLNVPETNTAPPVHVPGSCDKVTDLEFSYQPSDKTFHYAYYIKTQKRMLGPGQQLFITIDHPAFAFSDSEWRTAVATYYPSAGVGQLQAPPVILPFCTVFLDVAAQGQQGWNVTNNIGTTGISFSHTMREIHNCRAVPFQRLSNIIMENKLNGQSGDVHVNEETEMRDTFAL